MDLQTQGMSERQARGELEQHWPGSSPRRVAAGLGDPRTVSMPPTVDG